MSDYPMGWHPNFSLEKRLELYREFTNQNPQEHSVGSLVTILWILSYIWSLYDLLKYFVQIDDALLEIYTEGVIYGDSRSMISPDLHLYLESISCSRKQT